MNGMSVIWLPSVILMIAEIRKNAYKQNKKHQFNHVDFYVKKGINLPVSSLNKTHFKDT